VCVHSLGAIGIASSFASVHGVADSAAAYVSIGVAVIALFARVLLAPFEYMPWPRLAAWSGVTNEKEAKPEGERPRRTCDDCGRNSRARSPKLCSLTRPRSLTKLSSLTRRGAAEGAEEDDTFGVLVNVQGTRSPARPRGRLTLVRREGGVSQLQSRLAKERALQHAEEARRRARNEKSLSQAPKPPAASIAGGSSNTGEKLLEMPSPASPPSPRLKIERDTAVVWGRQTRKKRLAEVLEAAADVRLSKVERELSAEAARRTAVSAAAYAQIQQARSRAMSDKGDDKGAAGAATALDSQRGWLERTVHTTMVSDVGTSTSREFEAQAREAAADWLLDVIARPVAVTPSHDDNEISSRLQYRLSRVRTAGKHSTTQQQQLPHQFA